MLRLTLTKILLKPNPYKVFRKVKVQNYLKWNPLSLSSLLQQNLSTETKYRDMKKSFTDEEVEAIKEKFCHLPSFQNNEFHESDFGEIAKIMNFQRTPKQIEAYQKYWREKYDGKVSLDKGIRLLRTVTDLHSYALEYSVLADTDSDGFINSKEFKDIFELISSHCDDPKIDMVEYEAFVKEADTNHDGKVSIKESAKWIESHLKDFYHSH